MRNKFFQKLKIKLFPVIFFTLVISSFVLHSRLYAEESSRQTFIITPAIINIDQADKNIESFRIKFTNNTLKDVLVKIRIRRYELEEGQFRPYEEVTDKSLIPLKILEDEFTAKNGSFHESEVTVDKDKIEKDEYQYWGIVFRTSDLSEKGETVGLSSELVSIVAIKGRNIEDALVLEVIPKKPLIPIRLVMQKHVYVTVKNIGNSMYKYNGEAKLTKGTLKMRGKLLDSALLNPKSNYLLPGDSDTVTLDWSGYKGISFWKRIGFYSVHASAKYTESEGTFTNSYQFFYLPWWLVLLIMAVLYILWRVYRNIKENKKKRRRKSA